MSHKYDCTVMYDATASVTVTAESPEEAANKAETMADGRQSICHQCAENLETGDSIGVIVCNMKGVEILNTMFSPLNDSHVSTIALWIEREMPGRQGDSLANKLRKLGAGGVKNQLSSIELK